jgi:hypothetical protein
MSKPSISAQSLVRYIGARLPSERKSILRRQKDELAKKTIVPYYQQAITAIRSHHRGADNALDEMTQSLQRALENERRELQSAAEPDRKKIRNRISRLMNNIRVCSDYKAHFGDRVIMYRLRRCPALDIAGVRVSGEFTLAGELAGWRGHGPCAIVVDTHAEVPAPDDVANQLELSYALGGGERSGIPIGGFQVWHASSGRAWRMRQHSAMRWKKVRIWCAYIAARWDTRGESS